MAPYAQRKLSVLGDDAVKPRGLQPRRRVCASTGFSKNEEGGSLAVGMLLKAIPSSPTTVIPFSDCRQPAPQATFVGKVSEPVFAGHYVE